jgi:hypothetical protein
LRVLAVLFIIIINIWSNKLNAQNDTIKNSLVLNYGLSGSLNGVKQYSSNYRIPFNYNLYFYIETKHHRLNFTPSIHSKKTLYISSLPFERNLFINYDARYSNNLFYYTKSKRGRKIDGFYIAYQFNPNNPQKRINFFFQYEIDYIRNVIKKESIYTTDTEITGVHSEVFDDDFKYINTIIHNVIMLGYSFNFTKRLEFSHSFGVGIKSITDDFQFSNSGYNFVNRDLSLIRSFRFNLSYQLDEINFK